MRPLVLLLFLLAYPAYADRPPSTPVGVWEAPAGKARKAHVKIEPCAEKLCGRVVWLEQPNDKDGQPRVDRRNTNESLRGRPILGMPLLTDFVPDPERPDRWVDGRIYNPEDGEMYRSTLTLGPDGTLNVRGYVGVPVLGKSQTWRRVE